MLIPSPLIMLVDPKLTDNHLGIKILNLVSTFIPRNPIFCECSYSFVTEGEHAAGLDLVFYGQRHCDTLGVLDEKNEIQAEEIKDLMNNQSLYTNRQSFKASMHALVASLKECEEYVAEVVAGKREGDPEIGRKLNKVMSLFSTADVEMLERMVADNYEDLSLVSKIAKL